MRVPRIQKRRVGTATVLAWCAMATMAWAQGAPPAGAPPAGAPPAGGGGRGGGRGGPQIVSPEIGADKTITFRYMAPNATNVTLTDTLPAGSTLVSSASTRGTY